MQFTRMLFAAACLAPSSGLAFGNLDCIGTEVCENGRCEATATPFEIDFRWAAGEAQISLAGTSATVDLQIMEDGPDPDARHLEFARPDAETPAGLILDYAGGDIRAAVSLGMPATTYRATCAHRMAA